MTSLNKKFFKFLSIFTILSYSLYGFNSYAETAIEREAREYSLGVGEVIQTIEENAQRQVLETRRREVQRIQLTQSSQIKCLADNIYYEAGNQSTAGKLAVAEVTLNRVNSSKFPGSICSVVHQKTGRTCQFSWTCMRNRSPDPRVYDTARRLAVNIITNGLDDRLLPRNALFYHADYVNPGWNLRRITKIGDHIFYAG